VFVEGGLAVIILGMGEGGDLLSQENPYNIPRKKRISDEVTVWDQREEGGGTFPTTCSMNAEGGGGSDSFGLNNRKGGALTEVLVRKKHFGGLRKQAQWGGGGIMAA